MANFKTHFTVAAMVSGGLAASLFAVGRVAPDEVWALFALGTVGGILPDLDSDQSTPTQILFACLGVLLAFLTLFALGEGRSIMELLALLVLVFVLVRYLLGYLFARWTTHRGIFHSLIAAAFFGLATAAVANRFLGQPAQHAWLCGAFLALGYTLHLALDEIYAVDLGNRAFGRSFGSALKPFDLGNWRTSAAMALGALAAFLAAPDADGFLATYGSPGVYADIYDRFFPGGGLPLLGGR